MKKTNKIILLFILTIFLYSCSTLSEAGKVLRNEKIKTTDEFLVKKREPLVLPPDYKNLPKPGSLNREKIENKNTISKILKIKKENNSLKKGNTSVEQSIINKIGK